MEYIDITNEEFSLGNITDLNESFKNICTNFMPRTAEMIPFYS